MKILKKELQMLEVCRPENRHRCPRIHKFAFDRQSSGELILLMPSINPERAYVSVFRMITNNRQSFFHLVRTESCPYSVIVVHRRDIDRTVN